jgi:WhiB family transcriptional regulator, redox-sensing transcriptional regulator
MAAEIVSAPLFVSAEIQERSDEMRRQQAALKAATLIPLQRESEESGIDLDMAWQEAALCAQTEPEAFFPEKGGSTREAKRICGRCDVRGDCLQYALDNEERFGIWGGLSERERRRFKRLMS